MTAYFPIADAGGKVAGILYVGIPMAQFESMLAQTIESMAVAAGLAALLVLVLTLLVVRRVTKPLTSVTRSLTALAEGQSDVEIDCEDRADEIGEIARTVAVFRSNSQERARLRSEQAALRLQQPSSANPSCAISSRSSAAASAAFSTRC